MNLQKLAQLERMAGFIPNAFSEGRPLKKASATLKPMASTPPCDRSPTTHCSVPTLPAA